MQYILKKKERKKQRIIIIFSNYPTKVFTNTLIYLNIIFENIAKLIFYREIR